MILQMILLHYNVTITALLLLSGLLAILEALLGLYTEPFKTLFTLKVAENRDWLHILA